MADRRGPDSDDLETRLSPSPTSGNTRSASGRGNYKGNQPPPQELHRRQQKPQPVTSPTDSRRPVTIVRRESRADEMDARHTPSRLSSSQRSTSGRNQYKSSQAPPQRIHSRAVAERPVIASRPVAERENNRQAQRRPAAPVQRQQVQQQPRPQAQSQRQPEKSERGRKSNESERGRSKDKKNGGRRR